MKRLIFLFSSLVMFSSCFLFPTGNDDNDDADEEKLHLLWEYSYNNPEGYRPNTLPLIIDNRFIITSGDKSVTSHNILDGSINWRSQIHFNTSLRNREFALNNGIIAGTISKKIKAWNVYTGDQIWSVSIPDSLGWDNGRSVIGSTHNGFIVPSRSKYLYFISDDGVLDILPLDLDALITTIADNTVYTLQQKKLNIAIGGAYDLASMDLIWRYRFKQSKYSYHSYVPPVINRGMVYLFFDTFYERDSAIVGVNAENGAEIWRRSDLTARVVIINEDVMYGRSSVFVWAVNKHTGELLWRVEDFINSGFANYSIEYLDGYIYAPFHEGLMILDAESGEIVAHIKNDTEDSYHFIKAGAGRIFAQSAQKLHAFAPWGHTVPLEGY